MSPARRWAVLGLAIVAAVVAFVIAQPGGGSSDEKASPTHPATSTPAASAPAPAAAPTPPAPPTITVADGKPVGGVKTITVKKGERVRFTVRSDVADEVHVHGYDLMKDVGANGSVSFDFPANVDGGFDVELERRGEQIVSLKVEP